jgi:hypothetical protein
MHVLDRLDVQIRPGASGGELGWRAKQVLLARFNRMRLAPRLDEPESGDARAMALLEADVVMDLRAAVAPLMRDVPEEPEAFCAWFEALNETGPGQQDPLFPWLAQTATMAEMRWFLHQEIAGEAGFEDLLALTQIKMPIRAKLEMARNFWDEMGRGQAKGMHGPMLERLAAHLELCPTIETVVSPALALGNLMVALASNRGFGFHSVGALGVIEMTAPDRAAHVAQGLRRLGVSAKARHYFALHAVLDRRHSAAWNEEVILPLIEEDPRRARAIAEGALLRLYCGQRCFECYRQHFGLSRAGPIALQNPQDEEAGRGAFA